MPRKYHLYFDDTGNRDPDKVPGQQNRADSMDCFGLGGILIREDHIDQTIQAHGAFCEKHNLSYPLHSHSIRGGRGKFGWLKNPEKAGVFFPALEDYLLSLPIIATACIIHRPGYVARYKDKYKDQLWLMCKTAFSILIERSAKFVDENGSAMEVYFEQTGKREDRDIQKYMRELKAKGLEFDNKNSGNYQPLSADDFQRLCLGKPQRRTKTSALIQVADLVLFPVAKGGYTAGYRPFAKLQDAGKLIDCYLQSDDIPRRGIKYSCFDTQQTKGPA